MFDIGMIITDIIAKKRDGLELNEKEFTFVANGAAAGIIPDYQLSAFLMACFIKGLSFKESALLTKAMAMSGGKLNFKTKKPLADKHSTGGVGDGVSLALAPIAAAAGLAVPMMSGRGLSHTGGTLDKLESMPGFNINLTEKAVYAQISKIGVAMFGQTKDLAPADKKLYALRDVTATVPSVPLITASILSKKYAEGIKYLVMDVKFGSGAFMKKYEDAVKLAESLVKTGKLLGLKIVALITDMDEPLGRAVGNANEIRQTVAVLKEGAAAAPDFYELAVELCAQMLLLSKKTKDIKAARALAEAQVTSGRAFEIWKQMVKLQGAGTDFDRLKDAPLSAKITAPKNGYVAHIDALTTGRAALLLGAGRNKMEDSVDHGAGIYLERKSGSKVKKGDVIAVLYSSSAAKLKEGEALFKTALKITTAPPKKRPLIKKIIK